MNNNIYIGVAILMAVMVSGCLVNEVEQIDEQTTLKEENWLSFTTIDFRGTIKPSEYTIIDYLLPIQPIYDKIVGDDSKSAKFIVFGSICNNEFMYPFSGPVNSITVLIYNESEGLKICFETGAEYTEIGFNGIDKDVTFTEEDCKKVVIERDGKYYLNLSYTKITCFPINKTEVII